MSFTFWVVLWRTHFIWSKPLCFVTYDTFMTCNSSFFHHMSLFWCFSSSYIYLIRTYTSSLSIHNKDVPDPMIPFAWPFSKLPWEKGGLFLGGLSSPKWWVKEWSSFSISYGCGDAFPFLGVSFYECISLTWWFYVSYPLWMTTGSLETKCYSERSIMLV